MFRIRLDHPVDRVKGSNCSRLMWPTTMRVENDEYDSDPLLHKIYVTIL